MAEIGPEPGTPDYEAWRSEHPEGGRIMSVRTVPLHHATVRLAGAGDVAEIFGEPSERNFVLGYTREQGHPIPIDLEKFVQRSAGIFGATGTGKSFLTRMILAGLIHYGQASVLVFDMHNEYGYDDIASDTREPVIGLRTKFPAKVRVVGLGADTRIHGRTPDFNLVLAERDLAPEGTAHGAPRPAARAATRRAFPAQLAVWCGWKGPRRALPRRPGSMGTA
jgi:DNA helicase HerA-like ATPase